MPQNIMNMIAGSKESLGVKFKGGICAELCLNFGLKTAGILVILQSQDGFESDCPERKFQTITF